MKPSRLSTAEEIAPGFWRVRAWTSQGVVTTDVEGNDASEAIANAYRQRKEMTNE